MRCQCIAEFVLKTVEKKSTSPLVIKFYHSPCFQCNVAITNFLVLHTCEIRFHDVIDQGTLPIYSYGKILKHGRPTWPNEYVLESHFLNLIAGLNYVIKRI